MSWPRWRRCWTSLISFLSFSPFTISQNIPEHSTIVHVPLTSRILQTTLEWCRTFHWFPVHSIWLHRFGTIYYRLYGIKYKYHVVAVLYPQSCIHLSLDNPDSSHLLSSLSSALSSKPLNPVSLNPWFHRNPWSDSHWALRSCQALDIIQDSLLPHYGSQILCITVPLKHWNTVASITVTWESNDQFTPVTRRTTDDLPAHVKGTAYWLNHNTHPSGYYYAESGQTPVPVEFINDTWYILHFLSTEQIFGSRSLYQVDPNNPNISLGCWPDNQTQLPTQIIQVQTTDLTAPQEQSPVISESGLEQN